jgi:hypothetical protein
MDVLLLTSDSEGCPNVVIEALAIGTPVVAAPAGDTRFLIREGENGSLIWSRRIEDYVAATRSWLVRQKPRASADISLEIPTSDLERTHGIDQMVAGTVAVWELLLTNSVDPATAVQLSKLGDADPR